MLLPLILFSSWKLSKKNITNKEAFAQDETAGISLFFSDAHNLNLGDAIEIAVGGLNLTKNNGLLQLNLASSNIINKCKKFFSINKAYFYFLARCYSEFPPKLPKNKAASSFIDMFFYKTDWKDKNN